MSKKKAVAKAKQRARKAEEEPESVSSLLESSPEEVPQPASVKASRKSVGQNFPMTRPNYVRLVIGLVIIAFGYTLLGSEPYIDANSGAFSTALSIAPWVILGGYGFLFYAILYRPKTKPV